LSGAKQGGFDARHGAVQILLDVSLQRYRRKQSLHAGFKPALDDCKPNRNGAYVFPALLQIEESALQHNLILEELPLDRARW
jgi:hypothetical protein